jgi:cobyrinic acid a,c-diamide synthase
MAGLLRGDAAMQTRLCGLGLQGVELPEGTLRGHAFHYARAEIPVEPLALAINPNKGPSREAVYRRQRMTASFVHFYFPSNPAAAIGLFQP